MVAITLTATSSSPQSWPIPPDCPPGTSLLIEGWGSGSGGSGGSTSFRAGGAGGDYAPTTYNVTAGDITTGSIAYTIQDGSAGTAAANPTAGPDAVFGVAPKNIVPNGTDLHARRHPADAVI